MQRSIKIENIAGEVTNELKLTRATALSLPASRFVHIDKLVDGNYRIAYEKHLFPGKELSALKSIDFTDIPVASGKTTSGEIHFRGMGISVKVCKIGRMQGHQHSIHLVREKNDMWSILYHSDLIDDITNIDKLVFHRED